MRNVQSELVEPSPREPLELLRVRLVRVQVDVVLRPELVFEQTDVVLDAVDRPERIAARDPGTTGADRAGLLEDVQVR